jgi:hypothetical protein
MNVSKILVLSSTRKERDGIAEYTRQVFNPMFCRNGEVDVEVRDLTPGALLAAPFRKVDILHVQHEFFLFDRLVGVVRPVLLSVSLVLLPVAGPAAGNDHSFHLQRR